MEITIGILTGGLVLMALLVVVQSRNVLRRNQRPPDQALVLLVQDLVNVVLAATGPAGGQAPMKQARMPDPAPKDADAMRPGDERNEEAADKAVQMAYMGPPGS